MSDNPYRSYIELWETIAVCPLPAGWRNVYQEDDGSRSAYQSPALLLQELRATLICVRDGSGKRLSERTERLDPPYKTRVKFAEHELGELSVASDLKNYLGAIGPGENIETGSVVA